MSAPASSSIGATPWRAPNGAVGGRLHRPLRAAIAGVELLLAGLAIWGAFAVWSTVFETVIMPLRDGTELVSTRMAGNRAVGSIGLGALAGLLLVDAIKQVLLAVRARPRKARTRDQLDEWAAVDEA